MAKHVQSSAAERYNLIILRCFKENSDSSSPNWQLPFHCLNSMTQTSNPPSSRKDNLQAFSSCSNNDASYSNRIYRTPILTTPRSPKDLSKHLRTQGSFLWLVALGIFITYWPHFAADMLPS